MVSRLQDVGVMTYGHGPADEPSASAISQPGFQEQPSEAPAVLRFTKLQMRDKII